MMEIFLTDAIDEPGYLLGYMNLPACSKSQLSFVTFTWWSAFYRVIVRGNMYPFTQQQQQQQQQYSLFSQASWGRLEMKPERNKFKVQAHW